MDDTPPPDATPERRHRVPPGVSNHQRRNTHPITAEALDPRVAVDLEAKLAQRKRSGPSLRVASLEEQQRLATRILRRFGAFALQEPGKRVGGVKLTPSALKQCAAAWGIASDKLTILQGRPAQVLRVEESETQRAGVLALVRRLAELREQEDASAQQRPATGNAKSPGELTG